ncbi:MAG TPA: mobile mystery protein A [Ignavibacteria bacterium]
MSYNLLKIRQLDNKLRIVKEVLDENVPPKGWIYEIRNALQLTFGQLSRRIGISAPTIKVFENSEVKGTITLNSLRKFAESVNCKLVYAIVPNESLEKIIDNQIEKVAGGVVKRTSHSMNLENQNINSEEEKKQAEELKINLKAKFSSKIWNYEV